MKRALAIGLLFVLGACSTTVTEEERRWKRINGDTVWMVTDYGTTVHGVKDCPKLVQSKGQVKQCKVKNERVVDEQGLYATAPGVRADLCPVCVK